MQAKRKKHINEITEEFRPFWTGLLNDMGVENPIFYAKLCYNGSEFETVDGRKTTTLRFYADQLSKGQDIYVEAYNWDDLPYEEGYRVLYRFKNNPEWRDDKDSYVEITRKTDGTLLPNPSYTFRLSSLEEVNRTSITALAPELTSTAKEESDETFRYESADAEFLNTETFKKENLDTHFSQITIRDIYCIVQNVPFSNKEWLNTLISEGKKWKNQK